MNINLFSPKRHVKYHSKIYNFLMNEKARIKIKGMPRIVKTEYGWFMGWFESGGGRGVRPMHGTKSVFWLGLTEQDITREVSWHEYERIGVCVFGNNWHIFQQISRNYRRCRCCGLVQQRTVETIKTIERIAVYHDVKPISV